MRSENHISRHDRFIIQTSIFIVILLFQNCARVPFSQNQEESSTVGVLNYDPNNPIVSDQTIYIDNSPKKIDITSISASDPNNDPLQLILNNPITGREITNAEPFINTTSGYTVEYSGIPGIYTFTGKTQIEFTLPALVKDPDQNTTQFHLTFVFTHPIIQYKPSLAIRQTQCLLCHSYISGNLMTDMNTDYGFLARMTYADDTGTSINHSGDYIVNIKDWRNRSGFESSYITGNVYTVQRNFESTTKDLISKWITNQAMVPTPERAHPILKTNAPIVNETIGKYLNTVLNYRTDTELLAIKDPKYTSLTELSQLILPQVVMPSLATLNPTSSTVIELQELIINAPTQAEIMTQIKGTMVNGTLQRYSYYKRGANLSGFELSANGNYFTNTNSDYMICDGDLFVDGIIFLNGLQLKTISGCRIYATKGVYIQARRALKSTGVEGYEGIEYYLDAQNSSTANLQISSASKIIFGLGQTTSVTENANRYGSIKGGSLEYRYGRDNPILQEAYKITDSQGNYLLLDAAGDYNTPTYNKKVKFSRLLVNAPTVHSRYTDNFSGVIIANYAQFALGQFQFSYDPVFDRVPILPFLEPSSYFKAIECNPSSVVTLDTKLKGCRKQ